MDRAVKTPLTGRAEVLFAGPFELVDNMKAELVASPQTTVPTGGVVVRNSLGDPGHPGPGERGLICQVSGPEEAEALMLVTNHVVGPMEHAIALAANAAVSDPQLLRAWSTDVGRPDGRWFIEQRELSGQRRGPLVIRQIEPAHLLAVYSRLMRKENAQLQASAMFYGEAMRHLGPGTAVRTMVPLWTSVEAMGELLVGEECEELGIEGQKHRLVRIAEAMGIDPSTDNWTSITRARIYAKRIFGGEEEIADRLRRARNAFGHAKDDFTELAALATTDLTETSRLVRRAILTRLFPSTDPDQDTLDELLKTGIWQGNWTTGLEIRGIWAPDADGNEYDGFPIEPTRIELASGHAEISFSIPGGPDVHHVPLTIMSTTTRSAASGQDVQVDHEFRLSPAVERSGDDVSGADVSDARDDADGTPDDE